MKSSGEVQINQIINHTPEKMVYSHFGPLYYFYLACCLSSLQMYSCGSLAPKMGRGKRGGGCMDHKFRKPPEPWELADGCVTELLLKLLIFIYLFIHWCLLAYSRMFLFTYTKADSCMVRGNWEKHRGNPWPSTGC